MIRALILALVLALLYLTVAPDAWPGAIHFVVGLVCWYVAQVAVTWWRARCLRTETFDCALCGGTFEKGRSDEEAEAEYQVTFTEEQKAEPRKIACEDCYREIMGWYDLEREH